MFKLVAVIFAVVNGAPSDQPLTVLTYNHQTFETLESCMGFAQTEDGAAVRQTVNEMVMSQRGAIMAKLGCVEAKDDSI
jgi:hypothetical protein